MDKTKQGLIGRVSADSGRVLLIDPQYCEQENAELAAELDRTRSFPGPEPLSVERPIGYLQKALGIALVVPVTDGRVGHPVYGEYEDDRLVRLIVEFVS